MTINGESIVQVIFYLIITGLIFYLLWWLINYINPPEPFAKVARVLIAIVGVMICINVLLGLSGHAFISWK